MYACMHACMHVCIYVYIYICMERERERDRKCCVSFVLDVNTCTCVSIWSSADICLRMDDVFCVQVSMPPFERIIFKPNKHTKSIFSYTYTNGMHYAK